MITEDSLRELMSDPEVPASLSPALVRVRARALRRNRRAGLAGGVALVLPALVIGLARVPYWQGKSTGAGLPAAFAGDGTPLPVLAGGRVALVFPGMTAWATQDELCVSSVPRSNDGGWCRTDDPNEGDTYSFGGGALYGSVTEPIVRAEFIDGRQTLAAQVVGFALHPSWRVVSAVTTWPQADGDHNQITLRGWDAQGKLVVSVGCVGSCPTPEQPPALLPAAGDPAVPAATSALPSSAVDPSN